MLDHYDPIIAKLDNASVPECFIINALKYIEHYYKDPFRDLSISPWKVFGLNNQEYAELIQSVNSEDYQLIADAFLVYVNNATDFDFVAADDSKAAQDLLSNVIKVSDIAHRYIDTNLNLRFITTPTRTQIANLTCNQNIMLMEILKRVGYKYPMLDYLCN